MARKRVVEALQFDLLFEEDGTPAPVAGEPAEAAETALSSKRQRGIEAARRSLMGEDVGEELLEQPGGPSRPGETSEHALGIGDFYDRLKAAVRAGFADEVWVTGEIRKITVSKGHRYIELADHTTAEQSAGQPSGRGTLEAACWSREWPAIAARLDAAGIELAAGLVVRLRGRVSIWEAGARVRFSVSEVDVEALLGGIAAARRKLLNTLAAEGLLGANKSLPVPLVPLRIGLVTSPGSEAYRDFTGQLERSGYSFEVRLEPSLVQGPEAPAQIAAALARLQTTEQDLLVVVRGGGAKGDLAAFDHEEVARAIVSARLPVWTGIGHTGDHSVADELAQRALVTPTACGEAVVKAISEYLERLGAKADRLSRAGDRALDGSLMELQMRASTLARASRQELAGAAGALEAARMRTERGATIALGACGGALTRRSDRLAALLTQALSGSEHQLAARRVLLGSFDLTRQLERGFSLTRTAAGAIVRSVDQVQRGEEMVTVTADGSIFSVASSTKKRPASKEKEGS